MAYKSKYTMKELEQKAQLLYYAKNFRYAIYFYAFISFIFWFLNCFEVDGLYKFNWLFVLPYKFVQSFYKVEDVSIDFSLAIIGFIFLGLGLMYEFFINKMYNDVVDEQDRLERQLEQRKLQKRKTMARPKVEAEIQNTDNPAFEDSKLLYIIQPHVKRIKKKPTDIELTFQEVELWKQRINKKLLENIIYSKPMQKGYYRKNLFLIYKDFNYVDDFIYYITPTIESIILEFKRYGISTYFNYVVSALTNIENLEKELDCMDTILSLNFKGEIIVTNRFKITYDNKPVKKYKTKYKGEYNLSKNLSVSNKQPLYSLIGEEEEIGE